jgi:hypothetical protein
MDFFRESKKPIDNSHEDDQKNNDHDFSGHGIEHGNLPRISMVGSTFYAKPWVLR